MGLVLGCLVVMFCLFFVYMDGSFSLMFCGLFCYFSFVLLVCFALVCFCFRIGLIVVLCLLGCWFVGLLAVWLLIEFVVWCFVCDLIWLWLFSFSWWFVARLGWLMIFVLIFRVWFVEFGLRIVGFGLVDYLLIHVWCCSVCFDDCLLIDLWVVYGLICVFVCCVADCLY